MNRGRIRLIFLIFWLILAGLIVWFKVAPLGLATYYINYPGKYNLLDAKGSIGRFTPADRVDISSATAKIIGDPVYFSVATPRTFSEAKVTVTYKNNLTGSTPIIETGVLVDNVVWRYKLAPLENSLLEKGFNNWNQLNSGDVMLFQKNKNFSSVADFLTTLKTKPENICQGTKLSDCLVLYNTADLNNYFPETALPTTIPPFKPIDIPLQGTHQFYFMITASHEVDFAFDFTDLNLNKDTDSIVLSVYKNENKIYSKVIKDDFGGESSGKIRNFLSSFSLTNDKLTAGLYKLEIKAGDDIVIKKITKAPSALNIIGRVRPVATSDKTISFWTDSSFIKLTTNNPASRQLISFGNQNFNLSEAYKQFEFFNNTPGLKEVKLNHDDVVLENDGVFSFAPGDFFNPEFKSLDRHFVFSDQTEYVLTKYQAPQSSTENFKQASVTLNTKEAYREQGRYGFIISIPGLSLVNSGNIEIKEIKVEFSGRNLWDKIKEKVLSYVS